MSASQPLIDSTSRPTPPPAVCPFCALLCDDLVLTRLANRSFAIARNGCRRAAVDFARAPLAPTPRIAGRETSLDNAVRAAARLLRRARQPLFGGLATDVDGMRAAVDLAERCGATLDHAHGETLAAMTRLLQTRGWYAATLSELRNRADLVVLIGIDLADRYENLTRRCLRPAQTLDAETLAARRIVYLGATPPGAMVSGCVALKCSSAAIVDVLRAVLAALKQPTLTVARAGGMSANKIAALVASLRVARYSTLAFAPSALPAPRDPALALLCEIVDELNRNGRAALLPLGGDDGGQTAVSTCTWLTGYPLRLRYGATIDYQPTSNATARLLDGGGADALLWIDAYGRLGELPAKARLANSIVLGASRNARSDRAAVFIPVGTPGLDHAARLVRTDTVVSLALQAQRDSGLPAVATVLRAIEAQL